MKISLLGYQLHVGELEDLTFSERPTVINTINPHSYVVAKKDPAFHSALCAADYLVPDGVGVVIAARLLGHRIARFSGYRVFTSLMARASKEGLTVMFVGSSERTLSLIESRLRTDYPTVNAKFYSPPFVVKFTSEQDREILSFIDRHSPDILFVGMTAPKQEKWVWENLDHIHARAVASIGAVFNFYAGNIKRPSKFWRQIGLEWLVRLLNEPRRLWRRSLVSAPVFMLDVIRERMQQRSDRPRVG